MAYRTETPTPARLQRGSSYHRPPEHRLRHSWPSLHLPSIKPRPRLGVFSDFDAFITATSWSNINSLKFVTFSLSAYHEPADVSEYMKGWMHECLRTFLRSHWTCSWVNKAEVCSHEFSGHRPGTGLLTDSDPAADAGFDKQEPSWKEFLERFLCK